MVAAALVTVAAAAVVRAGTAGLRVQCCGVLWHVRLMFIAAGMSTWLGKVSQAASMLYGMQCVDMCSVCAGVTPGVAVLYWTRLPFPLLCQRWECADVCLCVFLGFSRVLVPRALGFWSTGRWVAESELLAAFSCLPAVTSFDTCPKGSQSVCCCQL